MLEKESDSSDSPRPGNLGVPAGAAIIVVCFFLPWISLGHSSAMAISSDPQQASVALAYLRIPRTSGIARVRTLYLIPIVALSTLMLELVVPPGHVGRRFARLGVLAAGAALSIFFISFGLLLGSKLAYGFWGALTGALFLTVGGLFNEARSE